MECANLETRDGQAVSLLGVRISGDLRGLMFEACIEQRFCNPTDKNVEIVYNFPLPWGAVLLDVDVLLGGKHLSGAVVEKKLAWARYEETLSEGMAAIMLEKNHDHSYSLNLGNLAAREHCVITLRYAQTMRFEQRGLRLLIPTVIAPRYGNALRDGALMPHQAHSHSLTVEHPFELELRLHGELAQSRVISPSHTVGVVHENHGADGVLTVSLAHRGSLDRDFVLVVDRLVHDGIAVAARDSVEPDGVAVLVSFCPRVHGQGKRATAVKILVDCSGSMAGDSIEAAKRALQAIVGQFDAGDRFSLSRFGSTVEHRSLGLWKATETTRLAARRWVGDLNADLGGTEMQAALSSTFALAQTVNSELLLVTDGEISAIDSTIGSAKASGHRLFVVGIGSSPAEPLLRRLAEATGGACDFVAPGEAVEPAVLRMFARLRSPRRTDLGLVWPAGVAPGWVSPLPHSVFDGDTVNVFALLGQVPAGEVRLQGRCSEDGALQEIGCAAFAAGIEAADTLPRMAASVRIHDTLTGKTPDATGLALAYRLVSDKTNFLLVHERPDGTKAIDMPVLQKVDQMVPAGWGGVASITGLEKISCSNRKVLDPMSIIVNAYRTPRAPLGNYCRSPLSDIGILPASLRKSDQIAKHDDPRYWTESEHYSGLTPLGLSEWLRTTPAPEWPGTYIGLRQMGLGAGLIDWLERSIALHGGAVHAEPTVVQAFLHLMSRPDTHDALTEVKPLLGIIRSTASRLRALFASDRAAKTASVEMLLVEAMAVVLKDMTARAWPEQVFAFEGAGGDGRGVGEASIFFA